MAEWAAAETAPETKNQLATIRRRHVVVSIHTDPADPVIINQPTIEEDERM
jgi:hypothetical protein